MAALVKSLTLPGGRRIRLADELAGRVRTAVVALAGLTVGSEPAVWTETEQLAERLRAEHAGKLPSQIPGLQEARDLYKSFGMEPSRHRPSSEALLRRVLQGKELYRLDSAVDCCNLASLTFLLPIGLYDLARIDGDITLRIGEDGEEFEGIRKGPVHLAGRLGLFDRQGGFGSPTSDSRRTCVTAGTSEILAVIMATAGYPAARLRDHRHHLADLYGRHCGAHVTVTADLGIREAGVQDAGD